MRKKIKLKIIELLQLCLGWLNKEYVAEEHARRLDQVRFFFHETLPSINEDWSGKTFIEGGTYNYFALPSGSLPKYDFVFPEIPLYIIVAGISSADWAQARQNGVSREVWENYQYDLAYFEKLTPQLATIGMAAIPKIVILRWNDPINHLSLVERLQEIA